MEAHPLSTATRTIDLTEAPVTVEDPSLVLPSPPDDREKHLYSDRRLPVLLVASLLSLGCLTVSQVHLLSLKPWLWWLVPFLVFTLAYYLISFRVNLPSRNFDLRTHRAVVASWAPLVAPTVDVWLPICGEDAAVLANTWRHVGHMADHYRGRVEVYVLDDGDRAEAAELARRMGFHYLVRPNRGWFKKAGNLRYGYEHSDGEFIVIFDADFCPREDFLDETLPYMEADPGLGIVQTPQYFRQDPRQTWMERGAGAVQELFYRVVQVSRDRLGGAICVGSCGLYRRAALDTTGGTTLIEHSEDVHTGFDLRRAGWSLRYLPIPLATGMCPSGPDSFYTQQYRWCAGSMSLLGSRKFWRTRMGVGTRFCYLSGFCYYIHTAIATFVLPVIPIVMLALLPGQVQLRNYLWIAPSTAFNLVIFPQWNHGRYGTSSLMAKSLYGWAHFFAITDILRSRQMGWMTTGARTRRPTARLWRGIAIWGGVTAAVWIGLSVFRMATMSPLNFLFLFLIGMVYAITCVAMPFAARWQADRREAAIQTT
jgi:cellulose synthase (UDP-forming)